MKIRSEITKGEAIRFISHLDYARAVERALRRAKLPVAYSEGFNPHMKMAFASALSVGVVSHAEYLDVELTQEMAATDFAAALSPQFPAGIGFVRAKAITPRHQSLMAVVNLATYRISWDKATPNADWELAVAEFNKAVAVPFVKENPKGRREIDIKEYLAKPALLTREGEFPVLELAIRITPTGSVKPAEVVEVLVRDFGLAVAAEGARINRTGLFVADGDTWLSPLDI